MVSLFFVCFFWEGFVLWDLELGMSNVNGLNIFRSLGRWILEVDFQGSKQQVSATIASASNKVGDH